MASPQIPQPFFIQQPQERRGLGETLLLSLAQAAPSVLFQFLERSDVGAAREAEGETGRAVTAAMLGQDEFRPEAVSALRQLGVADVDPTGGGSMLLLGSDAARTPTFDFDLEALDPRVAAQLPAQIREQSQAAASQRESTARTEQAKALTQESIGRESRAEESFDLEQQLLDAQVSSQRAQADFTRARTLTENARRQPELDLLASQLEAAESETERNRLQMKLAQSQEATDQIARVQAATGLYQDLMAMIDNERQVMFAITEDPGAAESAAGDLATKVFGQPDPPPLSEWVQQTLAGGTEGPEDLLDRLAFGGKTPQQVAQSFGLGSAEVQEIDRRIVAARQDAGTNSLDNESLNEIYRGLLEDVKARSEVMQDQNDLPDDFVQQELATAATQYSRYFNVLSGGDFQPEPDIVEEVAGVTREGWGTLVKELIRTGIQTAPASTPLGLAREGVQQLSRDLGGFDIESLIEQLRQFQQAQSGGN